MSRHVRHARSASLALATLVLALAAACGGSEAPASHTVNKNGVMHAPGLTAPLTNCVACHGSTLQGGSGPSCTSCHGQVW